MTDETKEPETENNEETTALDIVYAISRAAVPIAAIIGAVTIIVTGHGNESGWGWLVLLAFMLTV